ncbi:MAG: carboxypeptidase M32 [Anaerolineae bacterium]|nr:carboxypeptidase M32 [Anaerolineae bacterium]
MEHKLAELKTRLLEVDDLQYAGAVLYWDQATYMPPAGASARGRQLGTLTRLAHEKFTDAAIGKLLDDLRAYGEGLPYDSDDASLIRVTRRQYERAVKVPATFMAEMSQHFNTTYTAWTEARPANDFNRVRPLLEQTLDLSRQLADFFPGYDHIADPLVDNQDYGMKAADIRRIFAELRAELVPLVKAITAKPLTDDSCLRAFYPEDQQKAFGEMVIKRYGYDFERGRQDKTHHPFMIRFGPGDIRITTRFNEHDLGDGLFSTLHECGHALYEMGIDQGLAGTPLATGTSAGVHESQSRLWENIVGRSRGFWEHFYPALQQTFPDQLNRVSVDTFYRAINKVQPSLIRVDADEVTYNLHVMLRFDLELEMLEGKLDIRDLPEAWHQRYMDDLGVTAPSDKDGVLQDVHWYTFNIGGAFQGYTLGNILSGLYYSAALQAHPSIPAEIAQGKFDTLHTWLKTNIYTHGSKLSASELTERVTGGQLRIGPYIQYLKTKYGELYGIQ